MVKFFYTYILHCVDDSYYVGVTNNLDLRLSQHQEGQIPSCYTFSKRPVKLVCHQMFPDPNQALINGEFDKLPNLSMKKFKK
ncbi:MAG: GIY-YIG nuclease family protein [Flavobacteriales bacterium]